MGPLRAKLRRAPGTCRPSSWTRSSPRDPAYGEIVCRCERVTEAEIVAAIRRGHTTLDGIKYFTRAQMGRCQGGFCTYKILKILMRETGMGWDEISKKAAARRCSRGEL